MHIQSMAIIITIELIYTKVEPKSSNPDNSKAPPSIRECNSTRLTPLYILTKGDFPLTIDIVPIIIEDIPTIIIVLIKIFSPYRCHITIL